jgi:hypothetical protein
MLETEPTIKSINTNAEDYLSIVKTYTRQRKRMGSAVIDNAFV